MINVGKLGNMRLQGSTKDGFVKIGKKGEAVK